MVDGGHQQFSIISQTKITFFLISENVTAWKDVWIIGEEFVNETWNAIREIQVAAADKKKPGLYLFREYNVKCFTTNPTSHRSCTPAKLLNAFIKALNNVTGGKEKKLPHLVIFIPDWDLVKYVNYHKPGVKDMFSSILSWIMTNANRAVQSKKDSLSHRKQGAVIDSEPKFIWVKMIERVGGEYERALTVCYQFNASLEDELASHKKHYILDVGKAIAESYYFTARNQLNGDGKHKFWHEIDEWIEKFDHDKDVLKPVKQPAFEATGYSSYRKLKMDKKHHKISHYY